MTFTLIREIITFLSGASGSVPRPLRGPARMAVRCLSWAILFGLIYAFSGQTHKFIYTNF